jgi:hypothetical protein
MADPLESACLLVGRFMYRFAHIEKKIDQAVIKLLSLDEKTAPMVASIDFAKKLDDLVRASASRMLRKKKSSRKKFVIECMISTAIDGLLRMPLSSPLLAAEYYSAGP